jgi:hypothetical protein
MRKDPGQMGQQEFNKEFEAMQQEAKMQYSVMSETTKDLERANEAMDDLKYQLADVLRAAGAKAQKKAVQPEDGSQPAEEKP